MNITDEILKTAMLGTEKFTPAAHPELSEFAQKIATTQADKEDAFLKYAAAGLLYEECGREPVDVPTKLTPCPEETRPYFPANAVSALKTAIDTDDTIFLRYLIYKCNQRNEVLPAEVIPLILNEGLSSVSKASPLVQACGELGQWLISLQKTWKPLAAATPKAIESNWETGTTEERKRHLTDLRATNPKAAIPLLEAAFPQENANLRAEFLAILETGLSIDDIPFLETQLPDKSKKVKEAAQNLLKRIPGSKINQLYEAHVLKVLSIKEQRVMIFNKKKVLEIHPGITPSEEFFATGIDKVSSTKGVNDHLFWLSQALAFISPDAILHHFQLSLDEWMDLLPKDDTTWVFENGLSSAAILHRHIPLAKALMTRNIRHSMDLLHVIPPQERGPFQAKLVEAHLSELVDDLADDAYTPISRELAVLILESLKPGPYRITQHQYRRLALHLPLGMAGKLKDFTISGADESGMNCFHENQLQEMARILDIRESLKL